MPLRTICRECPNVIDRSVVGKPPRWHITWPQILFQVLQIRMEPVFQHEEMTGIECHLAAHVDVVWLPEMHVPHAFRQVSNYIFAIDKTMVAHTLQRGYEICVAHPRRPEGIKRSSIPQACQQSSHGRTQTVPGK